MASLTTCLKKAGAYLPAEDRAAILAAAQGSRAGGMKAGEAGRAAVLAQLEAVRQELSAAEGALQRAESAPPSGSAAPLYQDADAPRAQISLAADITASPSVISLLEGADLSSFIHESGHFFLEVQSDLAIRIQQQIDSGAGVGDGERGIVDDMNRLLAWFGVKGDENYSPLTEWAGMTLEQKREHHEKFARGFEAFSMEGKAPSLDLQPIFTRFRSWLVQVYKTLRGLNVALDDDVRAVMGRMLATDQAIEEAEAARNMLPMVKSWEEAQRLGWDKDQYDAYQALAQDATDKATQTLQARGMKDMKWLSRARDKALKARQQEVEEQRREIRQEIRMETMSEPVYRAWQFLTGKDSAGSKTDAEMALAAERAAHRESRKAAEAAAAGAEREKVRSENGGATGVQIGQALQKAKRQIDINVQQAMLAWDQANPEPGPEKKASTKLRRDALDITRDSILVAIAKLGGISRDSVKRDLSVSEDDLTIDVGVFGSKPFRATGGRGADDMAHALAELNYLPFDEDGKVSIRELEEALIDEIGGSPRYSYAYDYARANGEDIQPLSEDVIYGKLDTERLRDMYGNKPTATWRKLSAQRMTSESGGIDPDVVAETFGFDSGDALVKSLADAVPPRELIEARTDERMLEMFGDISSPESLQRAADEAIHNEVRARFIAAELKALQDANTVSQDTGRRTRAGRAVKVNVMAKAAKEYAAQIVGRLRVRDLRPGQYTAAEARNAKMADKALSGGKIEEAAMHKRNQLVNNYAAKSVMDAQAEVAAVVKYLRKFDKPVKSIDAGYQDQIDAVLERFNFKPASLTAVDQRKSLAEWVAQQQAMGNEPNIPDDVLNEAVRKSYKDMTLEELRGVVDTVKQIEHLGRLKNKLLLARDKRAFDAIAGEMAATIVQYGGEARPVELEGARGVMPWLEGVAAQHRKLSSLFRQMDGGKDDGPMYEHIGRAMNERGTLEDSMMESATEALAKLYAPLLKMKGGITGYRSKVFISEINASLTRGGRLAVALNWGNEQNRQRIRDGDKWTDAQVNAILKTLTATELEFVNGVWEYIDSYWPEVAAKEERLTGVAPEKVRAEPFVLVAADGAEVPMRGGYYPLKYDTDRSDRADQQEAAQVAKEMMQGAFTKATTRRGHTKARVEEVKRAVRKDLNVLTQHVTQVVHDLAWHEWLIDTNKLLTDDGIVSAIRTHYGPKVLKTIRDGVLGIASADVTSQTDIDKALLLARSNVTRATMGASITTAFLQPFGLTQSMVRIGPRHVLRGMARWGGEAVRMESSLTWIHDKSEFMRLRSKTFNRELREISQRVGGKSKVMQAVDSGLFMLTQKMQLVADVPTWIGQYEKTMAEGPTADTDEARRALEEKAVAAADRAVIEAQGAGATKDLAEVQRKHPMLTQFYSYFSVTLNLTAERTAATNFKNPRAVAGWLGDMALLLVIPAILPAMLLDALKGGGDDDEESWLKKIAQWQVGYLMGTVVGVRELSGAVSGFDYAGPPVGRIVGDLGKAGQQTAQGEIDEAAVLAYARLIGSAFGIPMTQIIRSYKGWAAWDEGQEGAGPQSVLLGPPPKD